MTKNWIALPMVALVATGVVACSDSPVGLPAGGPNFELVDASLRVELEEVNAHVFGTFKVGNGGSGSQVIGGGADADFPGHPKAGPGKCGVNGDPGVWYNPQGKRTSGGPTLETAHPHCIKLGSAGVTVMLEGISAEWEGEGEWLKLARGNNGRVAAAHKNNGGQGEILGYAVDIATDVRVGTIYIDLEEQYGEDNVAYADDCNISGADTADGNAVVGVDCLPQTITAIYTPLGGTVDDEKEVQGFLWWVNFDTGSQDDYINHEQDT